MDFQNTALELFDNYKSFYQKNKIIVGFAFSTQNLLVRCVVPVLRGPKQDDLKAPMKCLKGFSLEQILNYAEYVKTFIEEEKFPR